MKFASYFYFDIDLFRNLLNETNEMHCKMARFIGLWSLIFNISLVSLSVFCVCRCQSAFMHSHFMYHPHRVDRTVNGVRSALTWPFFKENFYALTKREENTAQISFALSLSQSVCVVYCLGELNNFNTVDCFVKVRSKIDHFKNRSLLPAILFSNEKWMKIEKSQHHPIE